MNPSDKIKQRDQLLSVAEKQWAKTTQSDSPARSCEDWLHDLQVHQIELEMQNEALRQAQIALEESRDRYVDLFEFAPVGYLTLTPDDMIAEINLTGSILLGRERKNLLHKRFSSLIIPEDQERWIRHFISVKGPNKQGSIELALQRGDGTLFHAQLDCVCPAALNSNPSGKTAFGVRIALTDISIRKMTEAALQASEEQYRRLAEDMPIFIATFLPDGTLTYVNDALTKLTDVPRAKLVGMNFYDFLSADDREMVKDRLALLTPEQPVETHEQIYQVPGQKDAYHQWTNRAFFDAKHKPTRFQAIGKDITERKLAEVELLSAKQAAEQASITKSRFLAAASHDLRQPILAINLFSYSLSKTRLSEDQKKISDFLTLAVRTLGDLLNVLLDISKLDAGVVKPAPEEILSGDMFGRIDANFSALLAQKNLRLILHYPTKEITLFTDPKLLHGLIGNLIGNAIKYTEQGGILVGIRRRGKLGLIQIWDTGIGIAPEHIPNIFEEYFQVGNPELDQAQGLGLGLSIVKRLANLLGIQISCRSCLGRGSVFEISLPLLDKPANQEPLRKQFTYENDETTSRLAGRSVVLIEDNIYVEAALELSLTSLGMSVIKFGTAEEALENSEIAVADFYISDFRLPGMNGLQLLDAIQQCSPEPIKAVLLTGDSSPDRIKLTQSCCWTVLFKPVDLPTLVSALAVQDSNY